MARQQPVGQSIGFFRDLSDKYVEKWKAIHANRVPAMQAHRIGQALGTAGDQDALLGGGRTSSSVAIEMGQLGGHALLDAETAIDGAIERLRREVDKLAVMQRRVAENVFSASAAQQHEVDEKRKALRRESQRVQRSIVGLPAVASPAEAAMAQLMQRAKATALQECVKELNQQEMREVQARTRNSTAEQKSSMSEVFRQLAEPTPAYTQQQMQQLVNMQQDYEQRDHEIADMIREITEIHEIMRDLNTLVVEQGSMVDRIDQNIQAAAEAVEAGAEQVRRAHETSKKSFLPMCMLVLIAMIMIVFVLMIILKG